MQQVKQCVPILWLFIAFLALRMPGYKGCFIALVIAVAESILFKTFGSSAILKGLTVSEALTASLEGVITAIWPIGIIIIAAMFTYNLCQETGAMDLIKKMLTSVTSDKRVLVLILAWGFGGFMEAVAGFGTAVAIPAAIMVGLGFDPLFSAVACLIANAAPPTFGSIGIPTTTAAGLVGMDPIVLSGPSMNMLAIPAFLSPFIIVWLTGRSENKKGAMKGMAGFTLLASLSYVLPALAVAHFVGAEFVDLVGNTVSLILMVAAAKLMRTASDPSFELEAGAVDGSSGKLPSFGYMTAWAPYIIMLVLLIVSSKLVAPVNALLGRFTSRFVVFSGEGGATIIFIIAVAKVMGYSGMTSSIATLLASLTGSFFPALAPIVGIIGTFVTGSTTSSGILFAKMQAEVAEQIGVNPVSLVAANMAGGAIGKLISPQSIAVAIAAIKLEGADGKIMAQTVKYCLVFGFIVCVLSYMTV